MAAPRLAWASCSPGWCPAGSRCLATRAVGVRGNASRACQNRGTLNADRRAAVQACSSAKSSCRPGTGTTKALTSSSVSSDGTATTATSSTSGCARMASSTSAGERFWPRRRRTSLRRETKVNVPSGVRGHQVAGVQPAVHHGGRGLLRHLPVARRDHRVAQQQLADLALADVVAVVVDHPRLVDHAQHRVLPHRAERAERPGPVPPDQAVRRLRQRVAAHDPQPEPALERLLPLLRRGRAGVAEPQRGVGVVRALRLPHQDLEHRADRVELGRPVPARRVQEAAGREPRQQHQPGAARQRPQHRVGRCVDVEQRQRRHQPVVGRELHPEREALAGHGVGTLRLHHQLRPPGGPRRRDQHRQVVRLDARRQRRPVGRVGRAPVAEQRRRRRAPPAEASGRR